jgi:hypothetical protein
MKSHGLRRPPEPEPDHAVAPCRDAVDEAPAPHAVGLARLIRGCRDDDGALTRLLDAVPTSERLAARLVLAREVDSPTIKRLLTLDVDLLKKLGTVDDATFKKLAALDETLLQKLLALDDDAFKKLAALDEQPLKEMLALLPAEIVEITKDLDKELIAKLLQEGELSPNELLQLVRMLGGPRIDSLAQILTPKGVARVFQAGGGTEAFALVERIAALEQSGQIQGMSRWVDFAFNQQNARGDNLLHLLNELREAERLAGTLGPGEAVSIGNDALKTAGKSFDQVIVDSNGNVLRRIEVKTLELDGTKFGDFSDGVRHGIEKARDLPAGVPGTKEASIITNFPPEKLPNGDPNFVQAGKFRFRYTADGRYTKFNDQIPPREIGKGDLIEEDLKPQAATWELVVDPMPAHVVFRPEVIVPRVRRLATIDAGAIAAWVAEALRQPRPAGSDATVTWIELGILATRARLPARFATGATLPLRVAGQPIDVPIERRDGEPWVAGPLGEAPLEPPFRLRLSQWYGGLVADVTAHWSIWTEAPSPGRAWLRDAAGALVGRGWSVQDPSRLLADEPAG